MAPRFEEQGQLQLLEREEDEEDDCFESIDKRKYLSARRLAFVFFGHKFASHEPVQGFDFRSYAPVLMLIDWIIKGLYPIDISRLIVRSDLLISRSKFIRRFALRSMESGISSLGISRFLDPWDRCSNCARHQRGRHQEAAGRRNLHLQRTHDAHQEGLFSSSC